MAGPQAAPAGAVTVSPGQHLGDVVDSRSAGTTYWLAPGTHEVRWQYTTPGLRAGAVGTLLGVVALLGWVGWYGRRR